MSVKGKKNTAKRAPAAKKKSRSTSSFFATGEDIKKNDRKRQVKQNYKKKKRKQREMPDWMYWSLASVFVAILILGAYRILIVPNSFRWKPCYGSKAFEMCVPNGYSIYGIDVSHHLHIPTTSRVLHPSFGLSFLLHPIGGVSRSRIPDHG